ncbi:MAG: hypothetical protein ACPGTO_01975 [Polaribacter sp.]
MKKLNQILMLLITCIILTSCDSLKGLLDKNPIDNKYDPIANFENSKHKITLEQSKKLYNNYNDRLRDTIMKFQKEDIPRENYNPTKYVLINIETLENYLKFLREVEKKNGGKDKKITGVAVFLGAQSDTARIENKAAFNKLDEEEKAKRREQRVEEDSEEVLSDEDIRGRITVFLAPTYRINKNVKSEVQKHIPFYIQPYNDLDPYVGYYESLMEKFTSAENNKKSLMRMQTTTSTTETSLNSNEFTNKPPRQ